MLVLIINLGTAPVHPRILLRPTFRTNLRTIHPDAGSNRISTYVKLFQPKRAFGLPNPSAFCVKLETYLRMTGISYELGVGDPREAPKGKVPWIDDDGLVLGDSALIIDYLKQKHGDPLDGRLTPKQQATGHVIQKMLEDSLYFVASHAKWVDDEGFAIYSAELFAGMPPEQLEYVPPMVRKRAIEKLNAQGIARHSRDEIHTLGIRDVQAFGNCWAPGRICLVTSQRRSMPAPSG